MLTTIAPVTPVPDAPPLRHWRLVRDLDDIVWLTIDREGESVNTLGEALIAELDTVCGLLEAAPPAALILISGKPGGFIAGADIREFSGFTRSADVSEKIRQGHAVFARFEQLPFSKVAAVDGFCLGGGLELALCCDWIVATDKPETRIGLPEVQLGIFPGLGGTVRVTERLGGLAGMELMLSARMLRARAAKSMGLIDALAGEQPDLRWAARKAALQGRKRARSGLPARLSNLAPARRVLAGVMAKKARAKARPEHYPAPYALIDLWRDHRGDRAAMFEHEARAVGELMVSPAAGGLRRVFHLMERLKEGAKGIDFPVRRVHVVGAGVMGGDIAAWCVLQGLEVTLQDRAESYIEAARERALKLFRRRLKKKPAVDAAMARLRSDVAGEGVSRADVVIEAIIEDLSAKQTLLSELEPKLRPAAVLATNTSALPLESLATALREPQRLIGLHFFNPVAKMPLLEVVRGEQSAAQYVDAGLAFAGAINRFGLPVKSSPGFLVNRVLAPYLMEAMRCLSEGLDKVQIDAAAVQFGMPMGPVELADTVGLDVCVKVAETLAGDQDLSAQKALLDELIINGNLGRKSGQGFYRWKDGKALKDKPANTDAAALEGLAERLLQPFLAECEACLADGVVSDADLLDAGIIFGTGFAPFRGGPMHYLSTRRSSGEV
ncbi:3-hydroxyacyl-CoA dehydrogenase NAD-binding domain-containing protein [Granulosicoccaceae sp. 1_MG-2023]|nr:3-hydroxyacyl-CoA dehydrogenase NAD-binding domain-containing protein [Granulosicoccaceae sp. 1_MG-2023]